MHPNAGLHKLLQSTQIGPVADYAIWVPCLLASRCVNMLSDTTYPNKDHIGFGFSGERIYEQDPKNTMSILVRPVERHSPIGSKLDLSNPMWPAVKSEKRLVFVDVQVPEQTGAFYIGTMIRLPEYDRFLATSEVGALSSSVLDELVDLYDDATSTVHRATTRERLKTGDLQVPCIRLEYAQADFVLDIDMVLIDAAVRARATLFGRNLDSSGRPRPQEENQNHRQKREETTIAMEKDVDNLQQLARASQPQQAIVKEMINQPKQELGPSSVEPRMSFDFTVETQQAKNYLHPV